MKKLASPFPWVGGKRLLREQIISMIPEHQCYAEVFAGGAWVYWGKEPSKVEVINDIDSNLTNLYTHIKKDVEAFYEKVWFMLASREEYHRYIKILKEKPQELSDLDRAVYYFYVIKNAFGGRFGSGFAFSKKQPPRSHIGYEDRLANIDGKFLLSYDDVPLIRKLYKGFKIEQTEPVRYTLSQEAQYKRELLIRNY